MGKYFTVVREECLVDFLWYKKLYGELAYEVPFYFYAKDSKEMKYLLEGIMRKPKVVLMGYKIVDATHGMWVLIGRAVDHPKLGTQMITTSRVLKIDFEKGVAETLNTIYLLRD